MDKSKYLLPRSFKLVGILFLIVGAILGIVRFHFGVKPDFLSCKMFAFCSSYLESKYLLFVRNNMGEEITGLLVISGLFMIAFSKEKIEDTAIGSLRLKAFFIAVYVDFFFLLASFLFTFGFAFVYMTMANMVVPFIAYIVSFRILYSMNRKQNRKNTTTFL